MTENEAIELLRSMQNPKQDYADIVCAPAFCTGFRFVYPEPEDYAIEEAIKALKEIQQYREIGTVEECWEAVEKQKAKKPIPINYKKYADKIENIEFLEDAYLCPNCKTVIRSGSFCGRCGQKLNWNENSEGMEDE